MLRFLHLLSFMLAMAVAVDPKLRVPSNIKLPLTTKSRWIVDQLGDRIKFACVNWASHMETLLPEGLADRTIDEISASIRSLGFNCVRYTVSIEQIENRTMPIGRSMRPAMSDAAFDSFFRINTKYDPNKTLVHEVFSDAMNSLKKHDLMVILDNHVSHATWCCNLNDDNRWWDSSRIFTGRWSHSSTEDNIFPVQPWVDGLTQLAIFAENPEWSHIVGIGLRNEVNTIGSKDDEWYKYMRMAAEAIYAENPNLLLVVGGTSFASYLKFLRNELLFPEESPIKPQVVFEFHFYNGPYIKPGWTIPGEYLTCKFMNWFINDRVGFIIEQGKEYTAPLWLSEFGLNVEKYDSTTNSADVMWLRCLKTWMKERDIDWSYWVLNGNYYLREGRKDFIEEWSLLSENHSVVRNPDLMDQLTDLMEVTQGSDDFDQPKFVIQ